MRDRVHRDLSKLLAQEHAALLAANFDDILRLTPLKEELLERLSDVDLSAEDLAVISGDIARNQVLLSAAMRGVHAARRSLSNAQAAKAGMKVYGADGQVSRLRMPGKGLSQKL